MDFRLLLHRLTLTSLFVGILGCAIVYVFHNWFHNDLVRLLSISHEMGDALGAFTAIALAFIAQHLVSVVLYRDWMLGLSLSETEQANRAHTYVIAAEEVGSELKQIKTFNDVVRGQLNTIVAETEKAAYDITLLFMFRHVRPPDEAHLASSRER